MAFIQQIQSMAQLLLPAKAPDTTVVNTRSDGYGNLALNTYFNKKQALAAEGTYFVTTNPTPGTALAVPIVTSYANTAACYWFQNNNPAGGPSAYLDYFKLVVAQVPTSTTICEYAVIRDVALALSVQVTTNHYTTANPVNVNPLSTNKSGCQLAYQNSATASVNVAPSGTSAIVARGNLGGLPILGDELIIDFGGDDTAAYAGSATASRKISVTAPMVVPPGFQIMIVPWFVGNSATGATFEFEFAHIER